MRCGTIDKLITADAAPRSKPWAAVMVAAVALSHLLTAGCNEAKSEVKESNNLIVEARKAVASGDSAKAIEALEASIEVHPNTWAYYELARLKLDAGDEAAATENVDKALALDPEGVDLLWLKGEIEKPVEKRFKGRFKDPPSSRK